MGVDGVYDWDYTQILGPCDHRNLVLSFDFSNEDFKVLDPPLGDRHLRTYRSAIRHLDLWVMTRSDDPGIPSSWEHLFTIGPLVGFRVLFFRSFRVDGDMLFTIEAYDSGYSKHEDEERESVLYNPTANNFTRRFGKAFISCFDYVESLFRLSNRKPISN